MVQSENQLQLHAIDKFAENCTICSAAKVSDFIRIVRILKVLFYVYFRHLLIFQTVSLYVRYCTIGIFGFTAQDFARKKLAALHLLP